MLHTAALIPDSSLQMEDLRCTDICKERDWHFGRSAKNSSRGKTLTNLTDVFLLEVSKNALACQIYSAQPLAFIA